MWLDDIVNPIYGCGIKMAPDINPIYAGLERSCPRDSKNISYVDVRLVQTCLDLIESWGWGGGGGRVVDSVRTQLSLGLNNFLKLKQVMIGCFTDQQNFQFSHF